MIEELLLVAAAEHSAVHCVANLINVADMLERVRSETRAVAGDRLVVTVSKSLVTLHTDEYKLHRILVNLIENAAKYAPDGPIDVQAVPAGGRAVFFVNDQGPGISAENRDKVFERFVQLDQSTTRRRGGLGLGLYLCRELSQMLGGELVLTESAGGGCCFTLSIEQRLNGEVEAEPGKITAPTAEQLESPWAFPSVSRRAAPPGIAANPLLKVGP